MTEVLFVDDHPDQIEPVARAFRLRTNLTTACVESVEQTLDFVRTGQVKVAVLDQRMEERLEITGTELFDRIHEVDPRVRAIIFSGESNKNDLVQANARGLSYLDKGCKPEELAHAILMQRANYLADLERDYDRTATVIGRHRKRRFFESSQVVELLTFEDFPAPPEIHDNEFVTVLEIGSGQNRREVRTLTVENAVQIEKENLSELNAELKIGAGIIKELNARAHDSLKKRVEIRNQTHEEHTLEENSRLSEADEKAGVVHRRIEMAPLYVRRRALIRVTCECCEQRRVFALNVRQWSGRYRRRQIDVNRDGTQSSYDLGDR